MKEIVPEYSFGGKNNEKGFGDQSVPNTFWATIPNRQFLWFGLVLCFTKCIESD